MATFDKKILEPGVYYPMTKTGKRVKRSFTPTTFRRWIDNFDKMIAAGLSVPAPWRHEAKAEPVRLKADQQDVDAYNNGGWWKKLWLDDDGAIWGTVHVPRESDADRVGKTVRECSPLAADEWKDGKFADYDDCLTHIAMVTHPIAPGQENFVRRDGTQVDQPEAIAAAIAEDCYGVALSSFNLLLSDAQMQALQAEETTTTTRVVAAEPTIQDVISVLRDLGVALPDDTTAENILERLMVAAVAIKAANSGEEGNETVPNTPPAGAEQQRPSPIVMSYDPATGTMTQVKVPTDAPGPGSTGDPNPTPSPTPNPTPEPAETVAMSTEQQSMLRFAQTIAVDRYRDRIRNLIGRKISQETATKFLKPYMDALSSGQLALSFSSDDGNYMAGTGELDRMLDLIDALPDFMGLNDPRGAMQLSHVGGRFELSNATPEPTDDLWTGPGNVPVTEDEANKIVDAQFKAAGRNGQ